MNIKSKQKRRAKLVRNYEVSGKSQDKKVTFYHPVFKWVNV